MKILSALFALVLAGMVSITFALEPRHAGQWHDPGLGYGVLLDYSAPIDQFGVTMLNYRLDGSGAVLSGAQNCRVGVSPCEIGLVEVSASFFGGLFGGEGPEIGDIVGSMDLEPEGEGLRISWELIGWLNDQEPGYCDVPPGGLWFRGCIGSRVLEQLTKPIP